MHESRGATAVIIGVVSLLLVGATWFYFVRQRPGPRPGSGGRSNPYANYMRDVGEIADSLGPTGTGNQPPARATGIQAPQDGRAGSPAAGAAAGTPYPSTVPAGGTGPRGNPAGNGGVPNGSSPIPR